MPFKAQLQRVVDNTPGCINCTLMAFDGISVDSANSSQFFSDVSVEDCNVEYAMSLKQMRKAATGLDAGGINELYVRGDKLITVMRPLVDDYLVAASFVPQALVGKGRFLLRLVAPQLCKDLV